jgi:hypothetical protein
LCETERSLLDGLLRGAAVEGGGEEEEEEEEEAATERLY